MTIISPLPFTLQNGTPADATQVMADLNHIVDQVNLNAAEGYIGSIIGKSTAQSILTSPTSISWDVALSDGLGFWSVSLPTRLTIPTGVSLVRINARAVLNAVGLTQAILGVYQNGSFVTGTQCLLGGTTTINPSIVTRPMTCSAGQYFEVKVQGNVASNITIGNAPETWVEIQVLD